MHNYATHRAYHAHSQLEELSPTCALARSVRAARRHSSCISWTHHFWLRGDNWTTGAIWPTLRVVV